MRCDQSGPRQGQQCGDEDSAPDRTRGHRSERPGTLPLRAICDIDGEGPRSYAPRGELEGTKTASETNGNNQCVQGRAKQSNGCSCRDCRNLIVANLFDLRERPCQ